MPWAAWAVVGCDVKHTDGMKLCVMVTETSLRVHIPKSKVRSLPLCTAGIQGQPEPVEIRGDPHLPFQVP